MRMNRMAALVAGAGMATLGACSDTQMGPERIATPDRSTLAVAGTVAGITSTPVPSEFRVCKEGNVPGTFTVTRVNAGLGSTSNSVVGANYVIQPGTCAVVAEDDSPANFGSNVTVLETSPGFVSVSGQQIELGGVPQPLSPVATNGGTWFINSIHGVRLTFVNHVEPPGNEGCTPGYWKQAQHFGSWAPVALNTTFSSVFGAGIFGGTLLEALGNNGGGLDALIRHGAAAYLNAQNATVDYAYTTAQVIDIVQGDGAYAGLSVEARKNLLDAANNGVDGCPLGRAE